MLWNPIRWERGKMVAFAKIRVDLRPFAVAHDVSRNYLALNAIHIFL
jgi:hypothetical protein